jgi:hypothetical protein
MTTSQEIIRQVQEEASEWLEMTNDPSIIVACILANKLIKLQNHVEYLERRFGYVSR